MQNRLPKILHISTPDTWRGGEQQMVYLIEELHKLGIEQHILCTKNSAVDRYFSSSAIKHTAVRKLFSTDPFFAHSVKKTCKKHRIEIIHAHDSHAHTFAVMATAMYGNSIPVIVSRRVDFPIRDSAVSVWKYNHPIVKKILCVSNTIKRITSEKITNKDVLATVYSGIDLSKFEQSFPVRGTLRREYSISDEELLIGNVAAIAPHKDYFTFLDTVTELLRRGVKAKFLAIGDGPMFLEIKAEIDKRGLKNHVIMTGFRKDIPLVLPELDVFLITSETEGLGTSILDAFACKVPVVATPAGGIPEIVVHEKTGLLGNIKNPLTLANQVERILADQALRKQLIEGASVKLQSFTKEATARETLQHYQSIL